jgi:hypothetical protein
MWCAIILEIVNLTMINIRYKARWELVDYFFQ